MIENDIRSIINQAQIAIEDAREVGVNIGKLKLEIKRLRSIIGYIGKFNEVCPYAHHPEIAELAGMIFTGEPKDLGNGDGT